ncbi:questin oxidase family protein [Streptomyces aculeolatus]|uniref:questin oxidase family protein n=1 Tax=Streptomyces aculeolatus TaxID=270689 RepID=UPI001CED51BC|nr:questin oxidase family protein [Streptomyces aculeolatus]
MDMSREEARTETGPGRTRDDSGVLDEALERLHASGPERDGWLSNHGPMAVEALVYGDRAATVHRWLDRYRDKLEDMPPQARPIDPAAWREALGDPSRLGDWPAYFARELTDRPWREVLAEWWPRLLPGLAGAATHTVIRAGHAVRTLQDTEAAGRTVTEPRVTELAHALGYWAARYARLPSAPVPDGTATPDAALAGVPAVPAQAGGIRERLAQLTPESTPGWPAAVSALAPARTPEEAREALAGLVRAAVHRYAAYGHGEPLMLVHAATAPNAVLRTLPALPRDLWVPSYAAAWAASAAVTAAYEPAAPLPPERIPAPPAGDAAQAADELLTRAAAHGDEHTIKFVDTALDVGDDTARVAALQSVALLDPVF